MAAVSRTAGPTAIARWTVRLRELQIARAGHAELLNSLMRATLSTDGTVLLSAAGVDATRPIDDQADAFWWNGQSDHALAAALTRGGEAADDGRVLTVTWQAPALVAPDAAGAVLKRIEA